MAGAAETLLMKAAKTGDAPRVRELLATEEGRATLDTEYGRQTALSYASGAGHYDCVDALVEAGADATLDGCRALWSAAMRGRTPIVIHLLRANPGEALPRDRLIWALQSACLNGHVACAYFLCELASLSLAFDAARMAEIKHNTLMTDWFNNDFTPLGGEQGTILPDAKVALASSCAGPQGRLWVRACVLLRRFPNPFTFACSNLGVRYTGYRREVGPGRA